MKETSRFIRPYKKFLNQKLAKNLRAAFDSVYDDPRHTPAERFMWDHWNLENQYRMHRTMARDFLPKNIYQNLQDSLVQFGQEHLGCHSISNPWLSYYTEGDEQMLHTDSPHGPWAYVYSLTNWDKRKFSGGETLILRPEILNYWENYNRSTGKEHSDIFTIVPPEFNQLLVFDPRLPHGVRRVSGVHDPREARLVIHGWFVNPEPFITGSLKMSEITKTLNAQIGEAFAQINIPENIQGILTLRIQINKNGQVLKMQDLTNTLVCRQPDQMQSFKNMLMKKLKLMKLPKSKGLSELTLPLIFD